MGITCNTCADASTKCREEYLRRVKCLPKGHVLVCTHHSELYGTTHHIDPLEGENFD